MKKEKKPRTRNLVAIASNRQSKFLSPNHMTSHHDKSTIAIKFNCFKHKLTMDVLVKGLLSLGLMSERSI